MERASQAPAIHHFQRPQAKAPEPVGTIVSDTTAETGDTGRLLLCAHCRKLITPCATRTRVNDRHAWERTNAGGYTHRFGCFAAAKGCASQGVPSKKDTWFAGFFWHVQICGGCGEHLGWLFFDDSGASGRAFYGLIFDQLIEVEGTPGGPE